MFRLSSIDSQKNNLSYQLLRIYIESGIPLLLILGNNIDGHALLAIGHENDMSQYKAPNDKTWVDISFFNKKLVFIDDNMPPYQKADIFESTLHYEKEEHKYLMLKSFIAPLPSHMFLVAEKAYALMELTLNDKEYGLPKDGTKWLTRLLLTGTHSFKEFIARKNDNKLDPKIKKYLLLLGLPRFIWLCEIYREDEITREVCSGLMIIDATSVSKNINSVLFYVRDEKLYEHNTIAWIADRSLRRFRTCTYRNNLKGEWYQWMS